MPIFRNCCFRACCVGLTSLSLGFYTPHTVLAAANERPPGRTYWGQYQDYTPSYGDFGTVGLLQMPNARVMPDGQFNVGGSRVYPYQRYFVSLQALPRFEAGFRITQILNRIEQGSLAFGGEQNFYDRGLDLKLLLLKESANRPAVAVGVRDLGGTSLFSSEYIVASKRWFNIDFTGGIAWGNMGSRGGISNPLRMLSDGFSDRTTGNAAGEFQNNFLRGRDIGVFGGIEYLTPIEGLRLKLEYDGNNYQNEALGNRFKVDSPLNIGVEYRPLPWLHASAGLERGNELMARVSLSQSFTRDGGLPKLDPKPAAIPPRPQGRTLRHTDTALLLQRHCPAYQEPDMTLAEIDDGTYRVHISTTCQPAMPAYRAAYERLLAFHREQIQHVAITVIAQGDAIGLPPLSYDDAADSSTVFRQLQKPLNAAVAASNATSNQQAKAIITALEADNFQVDAVQLGAHTAVAWVGHGKYRQIPRIIGRAAKILASHAPADIDTITVVLLENGMEVNSASFPRAALERIDTYQSSASELWHVSQLAAAYQPDSMGGYYPNPARYPSFGWSIAPALRQNVGGPDEYYLYQIYLSLNGEVQLAKGLSISAGYGFDIVNNFNKSQLESDSTLPRVRSDVRRYLREGESSITGLQMNYRMNIAPEWYGQLDAGLLELMFGGVGGQLLYAPFHKPWALGANLYRVRQRDYDGLFSFLDYETTTGHVSAYYKLPFYDLQAAVHAGRYLAGDTGVTLDISRRFDSGIEVGVFATKTNVSAEQFGEGSFDKGFYVNFPLDMFFLESSRTTRNFTFRPTTRDGGAMLATDPLYNSVRHTTKGALERDWPQLFD